MHRDEEQRDALSELPVRILIVEDDFLLGEALAAGLRQTGHAVDWFKSGAEADGAIASAAYDLTLPDLGLPRGDSMTWLSKRRARGVKVPIMILTARDAIDQRIAGRRRRPCQTPSASTNGPLAARLALQRRTGGRSQHGALATPTRGSAPARAVVRSPPSSRPRGW
jgi:two-component system response regulator QseB